MSDDEPKLLIFDASPETEHDGAGRMYRSRGIMDVAVLQKEVPMGLLRKNIRGFMQHVEGLLEDQKPPQGAFELESVQVNAQLSADGKIGFMGSGLGLKGTAGITFTFKRRREL